MNAGFRSGDRIIARTVTRISIGCIAGLFVLALPSIVLAQASVKHKQQAPEMRLSGDRVVLPIVMVREFPFVESSIAGIAGKLMLDTGHAHALAINDRRVPVVNAQAAGTGSFGSGQTFDVRTVPLVKDIRVGHLRYENVSQVKSQDAALLEGITPDFIGWVGHAFWEGYALKLDYGKLQAIFYREDVEDYLLGEKVISELSFELRKLPNIPVMKGIIAGIDTTVAFDTGQNGALFIDADTKSRMIGEGVLKWSGKGDKYDLYGLKLQGRTFDNLKDISVFITPFPAAVPTGLPEKALLTLGFSFLSKYKTVWDSTKKIIYVLEK